MAGKFSRRDFMKTAGATAAAFTIAQGKTPFAYAQNEKVRVACIGTGGQGSLHIRYGLSLAKNIKIVAVCDVFRPHLYQGWKHAGGQEAGVARYRDYREMLEKEEFEGVVIATQLSTHYPIVMDCLDAGKFVFCEKTLAYEIEHCRDIVKKCHETGLFCQVGHQRHYNPLYNKALWLIRDKGMFGRINHITAQWHRNNDWRRPLGKGFEMDDYEKEMIPDLERWINWRLYREYSGGLMTELATHQLDVANWYLGAIPRRVVGFGGTDYWRDGREVFDNIAVCYEYEIGRTTPGYQAITPPNEHISALTVNKPYTVRVTYSSILANAKLGASSLIQGDRAAIRLTEGEGCTIFAEGSPDKSEETETQSAEEAAAAFSTTDSPELPSSAYDTGVPLTVYAPDSEELLEITRPYVDQLQMEAFANCIKDGTVPKSNQICGLHAAIVGLTGMKALREGAQVEIDPALAEFDFETPDPFGYEDWPGPESKKESDETAEPENA